MNRLLFGLLSAACLVGVLTLPTAPSNGQDARQPSRDAAVLMSGKWQGSWLSFGPESRGYSFDAALEVRIDGTNSAEGAITWTLQKAPRDSMVANKIGRTAVEYVRGSYQPASRMLLVDGHRKDDVHELIALDKYRLILAENNQVLGGITDSHGTWQGLISLSLKR